MLTDLVRAFGMLSDGAVQRTLLIALAITVVLVIAMIPGAAALVHVEAGTGYPLLDRLLEVLSLAGTAVLAWLLFPVIVAAILGFLLDAVVAATERRHFPGLAPAHGQGFVPTLLYSLGFALLVLVLNLLILPLYLVPGLNIPVYLALNSYLLGREYVELVLAQRHPFAKLGALRRSHSRVLWSSGLVTALLLLVPVVNLLAPIIGSAFATLRLNRTNYTTSTGGPSRPGEEG